MRYGNEKGKMKLERVSEIFRGGKRIQNHLAFCMQMIYYCVVTWEKESTEWEDCLLKWVKNGSECECRKGKVVLLGGKEEFEYEVIVDGNKLEHYFI